MLHKNKNLIHKSSQFCFNLIINLYAQTEIISEPSTMKIALFLLFWINVNHFQLQLF